MSPRHATRGPAVSGWNDWWAIVEQSQIETDEKIATGRLHAFFAVQKPAIRFLVPLQPDERVQALDFVESREHAVSVWYEDGVIDGTIELPPGIRLSDFLHNHPGFVSMSGCSFRALDGSIIAKYQAVIVNTQTSIGVCEESNVAAELPETALAE